MASVRKTCLAFCGLLFAAIQSGRSNFVGNMEAVGHQMPNSIDTKGLSLIPPPMISPGSLGSKDGLDSILVSEFGQRGREYGDELWHRFANKAFRELSIRRIPTEIARPEIPKAFRSQIDMDEHIEEALQEGKLEAQLLTRVDELALKYMDNVISDFELQRESRGIESRKNNFVGTLKHEFGTMDSSFANTMWYFYRMPIFTRETSLGLQKSFMEPILPAGFQDEADFNRYITAIYKDGGVNSRIAKRTEELAASYLEGHQFPNGVDPTGHGLNPPPILTPGALGRKEGLNSVLVSEFGQRGLKYLDELWYRFADKVTRELSIRRVPAAIARPEIPPAFRSQLEMDSHIRIALQEGQLEAQMLTRVDDLSLKYMDDVISDFELQRGATGIESVKNSWVSTLTYEFGAMDSSFTNKMWYYYRMPIFTRETSLGLQKSFKEPILPAGFEDEKDFDNYITAIYRDGGIYSRIAERTQELAAAYIRDVIERGSSRTISCKDRCYAKHDPSNPGCQCNKECTRHGDCCPDFEQVCQKLQYCEGRCFASYDSRLPCQCNHKCMEKKDCCIDFRRHCLTDVKAAAKFEIEALMHNNEVFERLAAEFQSQIPTVGYPLERKFRPQCSAYESAGCENDELDYILRGDLEELKNSLKLVWMTIMAAENDDLLISSDVKEVITQAWMDGWGPESYFILHPAIKEAVANHPNTIFYRHGGFYSAIDAFRSILCLFRQCNVGICKLSGVHYSEVRLERAGSLLKEKWSSQEFNKIDPQVKHFDMDSSLQYDFADENRSLFDVWTVYLCSIEDMYGAAAFLLQYPTQKSLDLVIGRSTHCQCIDKFQGPYCNDCPQH